MYAQQVANIPAERRDVLFAEIRQLVNDIDAIDRSLEGIGEGVSVDEALEEIATKLGDELRRSSRRIKRSRAMILSNGNEEKGAADDDLR